MEYVANYINGLMRRTLKPAKLFNLVVTLQDGDRSRIDTYAFTSHAEAVQALLSAKSALDTGVEWVDFNYMHDGDGGCTFTLRTLPGCIVRTCSLQIVSA